MTEIEKKILKEDMEQRLLAVTDSLMDLLAVNAGREPDARVTTLTSCVGSDGAFIAVNGSAHIMKEHFVCFFNARPEFRQVVQDALDSMYKEADKLKI